MRHLLTELLIIIFSSVIIGCGSPVGSISDGGGNGGDGGSGRGQYDFLMLRPKRILYEVDGGVDGRFSRADDLTVFVADDNGYRSLDLSDPGLKLEVVIYPGTMAEEITAVTTYFPFSLPGRHIIRGTFGGKTDEYSIEVRGNLVNPGEGSGFVDIIWLD